MSRITSIDGEARAFVLRAEQYDDPQAILRKLVAKAPKSADDQDGNLEDAKERALQALVERFPQILPWGDWTASEGEGGAPASPQVAVVCRSLDGKKTDLVLLERWPDGDCRFVIVETKLVRNPEIHRTVVGQILEYAAGLCVEAMGGGRTIESRADTYWRQRSGQTWQETASGAFGEDWQGAWETAVDSATSGDIRLLIVSDSIPWDLRQAIAFLPAPLLLGGVEVQVHDSAGTKAVVRSSAVARSGDNKKRFDWPEWFKGISLSVVEVNAYPMDNGHALAAVPFDQPTARSAARVSLKEVLESSNPVWQEVHKHLAGMLEHLIGDHLVEFDAATQSVGYKVATRFRRNPIRLLSLRQNELRLAALYMRSQSGDPAGLENVRKAWEADVRRITGVTLDGTNRGLKKVDRLREPKVREALVQAVRETASRLHALDGPDQQPTLITPARPR